MRWIDDEDADRKTLNTSGVAGLRLLAPSTEVHRRLRDASLERAEAAAKIELIFLTGPRNGPVEPGLAPT